MLQQSIAQEIPVSSTMLTQLAAACRSAVDTRKAADYFHRLRGNVDAVDFTRDAELKAAGVPIVHDALNVLAAGAFKHGETSLASELLDMSEGIVPTLFAATLRLQFVLSRRGQLPSRARRLLQPQRFGEARGILQQVQSTGLSLDAAFASTYLRACAASTREAFNRAHTAESLGLPSPRSIQR